MLKKKISPDAFIHSSLVSFDFSSEEKSLQKKFREVFKERIQELYQEFLILETLERLSADFPLLKHSIDDTPLSNRSKNCLHAANIETVGDLVQYSPAELKLFRNMGANSVKEIVDFVKGIGF
jgi:DNA-directed RNA polymerase alpha subunit